MKVGTIIGFCFIMMMAITWCLIGELAQHLQTPTSADYYPNTLFITYLSGCASILLLVPWLVWRLHGTMTKKWRAEQQSLNIKKEIYYAKWAPVMMAVIFLCNYTWFLSLKHTLVSINSVLYNCIAVEVFVVSVPVLNEGVSVMKIFSVFISLLGVVLIIFLAPADDSSEITSTWYGYLLLLISLSFYCAQEVGYKVLVNKVSQLTLSPEERVLLVQRISDSLSSADNVRHERERSKSEDEFVPTMGINHDEEYEDDDEDVVAGKQESNIGKFMYSSMFLGVVGLCNAFCVVWLVVIWNYTGWEPFVWPDNNQVKLLLLNMTLSLVLILSIFAGTAFTTPLMVSVGSLLVIPFSIILDFFLHGTSPSGLEFLGIFCIACGFLCIFLAGEKGSKYATKRDCQGKFQNALYILFHEKYFFSNDKSTPELEWYQEDKRRLY